MPSGAKLLRDGTVLGKTPYRGTLPRGDRATKLVLQLPGHRDYSITVRPNATIKESVKLTPVPPPAAPTKPHDRPVNPFD